MAQAHRLDALVLLASCDKIVPAMLMAAARLDIPAIVCVGGPMLGGIEFDGRKSDFTSIEEALGMVSSYEAGCAVVNFAKTGVTARNVLTREAVRNAENMPAHCRNRGCLYRVSRHLFRCTPVL